MVILPYARQGLVLFSCRDGGLRRTEGTVHDCDTLPHAAMILLKIDASYVCGDFFFVITLPSECLIPLFFMCFGWTDWIVHVVYRLFKDCLCCLWICQTEQIFVVMILLSCYHGCVVNWDVLNAKTLIWLASADIRRSTGAPAGDFILSTARVYQHTPDLLICHWYHAEAIVYRLNWHFHEISTSPSWMCCGLTPVSHKPSVTFL